MVSDAPRVRWIVLGGLGVNWSGGYGLSVVKVKRSTSPYGMAVVVVVVVGMLILLIDNAFLGIRYNLYSSVSVVGGLTRVDLGQ